MKKLTEIYSTVIVIKYIYVNHNLVEKHYGKYHSEFYVYDKDDNLIEFYNSSGNIITYEYEFYQNGQLKRLKERGRLQKPYDLILPLIQK